MVDEAEQLLRESRPYPVPVPDRFIGPDGEPSDYLQADDLRPIAAQLIRECAELGFLASREVSFFWRKKGGQRHGKNMLGACQKPTGLLAYYAECDWVIWLAADNLKGVSTRVVEATLFHELLHCGTDDNLKPTVQPHDTEMFAAEVVRFGLWHSDLRVAAQAFEQLPLLEEVRT